MRLSYIVVACVLAVATHARADPSQRAEHRARHDYSRFSDGPRRVPTPRGASQVRAQALGLGTRTAASRAMHQPVSRRWRRAAAWRGEDVQRLLWPVDDGRFIRGFGFVRTTRPELRHDGVDIGARPGTVVRAAADGIVVYSDNGIRGFGNCVILAHPNGWVSLYAHNSRTTVQPGWRVRRGERIALVGSTGISRGPHVHFELFDGGSNIDPVPHFDGGPAYVRRVARRAFEAGRVAEPQPLRPDDRETPSELEPASIESESSPTRPAQVASGQLGTRALLRRLHRFQPDAALLEQAEGRSFRNLLWPVRGGRVRQSSRRALVVDATDAPIRAPADGLVVFADDGTLVLVHPMGWVTTLRGVDRLDAEVGTRVRRGEWIARGGRRVRVELRVGGRRVAPLERMVRVPE